MTKNLTPEIAQLDTVSDFRAVSFWMKKENVGWEQSLLNSLKWLVNQAKGFMNKAKWFASQAKQGWETARSFAIQAQTSTMEAGALAKTTATLKEETSELKKWADTSAWEARKSETVSKDTLIATQKEVITAESAKTEVVQSQEKIAQAEERIDEKIARIDEKESIEKSNPLV